MKKAYSDEEFARFRDFKAYYTEDDKPYKFDPQYYVDVFIDFLNNNPKYVEKVRDALGLNWGISFGGETILCSEDADK